MEKKAETPPFVVAGWHTADPIYQNFAIELIGDLRDLGYDTSNFHGVPKPAERERW